MDSRALARPSVAAPAASDPLPLSDAGPAAAATLVAGAGALGWLVAARPDLFRFEAPLEPVPILIGGLALLALSAAILRWPRAGLVLLVGLVYLNLSELLVRFHGLPSVLQALTLPFLAAGLLSRDRAGLRALATSPLTVLLLAYLLVVLVSTTVAWDAELADARALELAKGLLLYGMVALLCSDPERARAAGWTLVASAALLAALGVYQAATGDFERSFGGLARFKDAHIYGDVFAPRIAGPLGDPNFFAQILLPPLALALAIGSRSDDGKARVFAYGGAAVITAAVLLTYSRGAAVALLFVLFAMLAVRGFRRRDLGFAAAGLAAVLVLSPQGFSERLSTLRQLVSGEGPAPLHLDSSFEERRLLTLTASRMFLDRPTLGVGAGNYTARFDEYADRVGSSAREYGDPGAPRYPHNLYLEVGAETGVPGLLLFAAAIGGALWLLARARRRWDRAGEASAAGVAIGLQVGIGAYLVTGLFLHGEFQRYLWILLGMAAAVDLVARASTAPGASPAHPEVAG